MGKSFVTGIDIGHHSIKAVVMKPAGELFELVSYKEVPATETIFSDNHTLNHQEIVNYLAQLNKLTETPKYKDKILITVKDKLLPINIREIACFYTTEKSTCVYLADGRSYPYAKTLDQIYSTLDPSEFIRANKQYIISRNSIKDLTIWFDSRLLVNLTIDVPERIYVSKNKASEFKNWIINQK